MKDHFWILFLVPLLLFYSEDLPGQSWNFIKEKDGIKIYTRKEPNTSLKAFRGEITFQAEMDRVKLLLGDGNNLDWWINGVSHVETLSFKKDEYVQYYIVYRVPWPLLNRDVAADSRISIDSLTGIRMITIKPIPDVVEEKPGLVRIKKFWQIWVVEPMENGFIHVTVEGFVDPAGDIPAWLYNMFVTDTPYEVLKALRDRALSDKPLIN